MAGFNQVARTRFVDVTPGSRIKVEDYANAYEPFEAIVLELNPEYGPNSIPMLLLKAAHSEDPIPIMGDGRTFITVLVSSEVLRTDKRNPRAKHLQAVPREVYAIQFDGGVESATDAITFGAGRAGISYDRGTDNRTESLVLHSVSGDDRCFPGDWVVEDVEAGTIRFESSSSLLTKYEDFDE